jgi:hypothetical protein
MKPRSILFLSVLIFILLVAAAIPVLAQRASENPRAPRPADTTSLPAPDQALEPFSLLEPQWGGSWNDGTASPFAFTRFDGGYSLKQNMVYYMGGRLADSSTDGSVWSLSSGGVYTDLGVDLVTPVSNYTMNLLEDATGWGFYIFCGRNSLGNTIKSVQVYYPDTNTAVQLGPEDNYPGSITCTAALNVVHNNKVYVAGGQDATTSPYNWGETWVFDPLAPAGSRWTRIFSANLTRPRAFIMGAVVDNKIYAIGGNWYDPTATACGHVLCNVRLVEVLDLSDPLPTWDDAAAADLPEPCSEGRAFGFDTTSQYIDADDTHYAGRIVTTCGGWSVENERVYVYNSRVNRWEAFPSLNRTRRDQAAEFIPLAYVGLGVMFNWGGRSGSDANILAIPESYLIAAGGCSVLVVDDDWDFDTAGENDGGRPYYTSALNYLGYYYKVWDTVSQGTPTVTDLSAYDITVWFTGYDWTTPITLEEQTELIAYLEAGGNLFMSSQDQEYAFPGSTIMTDYFGVSSVTQDVTLLSVAGSTSDPLFAGLGAYTLRRPDDLLPYWPEPPTQGPYDDAVTAIPGAFTPLSYPSSGQASATRYDGGSFKTMYLAFPLEWVDTIQERAQILGTSLGWMCPIIEPVYIPLVMR